MLGRRGPDRDACRVLAGPAPLSGEAALAKLGELWTRCPKSRFREVPEKQQLDYTTI